MQQRAMKYSMDLTSQHQKNGYSYIAYDDKNRNLNTGRKRTRAEKLSGDPAYLPRVSPAKTRKTYNGHSNASSPSPNKNYYK